MKLMIAIDNFESAEIIVRACFPIIDRASRIKVHIISNLDCATEATLQLSQGHSEFYQSQEQSVATGLSECAARTLKAINFSYPNLSVDLTTQVSIGAFSPVLVAGATAWNPDLIIIGLPQGRFLTHFTHAKVNTSILRHVPCPILFVRL